jgi:DNA replication initiation complex subunit (GINS family)
MDYLDIIEFYKKEKNTSRLIPIDRNFYTEAENLIKNTGNDTEKANINNTLNFLKEKRVQKILIYLAYDKQIGNEVTPEESDLYLKIKSLLKKNKITASTKIKINIDVPEIITTSGTKLGPYNKNEIIELNSNEDMIFIIENKIGEKLS